MGRLLLLSVISILFLVGCNKNEIVDDNNLIKNTENQQQNDIIIDSGEKEKVDFYNKLLKARKNIENIENMEEVYAVNYTYIKQKEDKYLLRIVFSKLIDSSDSEYPVFDEEDNEIVEIELKADDKIIITQPWVLLDGTNQEMDAGAITVSELYNFGYFSWESRNGLYFWDIDENNIYISINMAGLT